MENKRTISDEMLDRYISGKASIEELAYVTQAMKKDSSLKELVGILEYMKETGSLDEDGNEIPMASMAALSDGNLCDVMCEQYILKDYTGSKATDDFIEEALDNRWLKEAGTPLHNMGHLLERYGMSVSRKYDCSLEEIEDCLSHKNKVIVVVDYGQLWNKESDGIFHAVVCINVANGIVRIFDPAINGHSNYPVEEFIQAWRYSKNYMVTAAAEALEYIPHPIDVSDVNLDEDLIELTEAIAENAHEIWASKRYSEGWRFGPKRDDVKLEHPDMIPYSELTEGEKYYDRDMAFNTIRLVKKLGFTLSRRYTLYCRHCGEYVSDTMHYCPNCGTKISLN